MAQADEVGVPGVTYGKDGTKYEVFASCSA
jgi:hypothetical protein